jgi:predicted membrane protein
MNDLGELVVYTLLSQLLLACLIGALFQIRDAMENADVADFSFWTLVASIITIIPFTLHSTLYGINLLP